MRLVACPDCHRQYDVEGIRGDRVGCPCGALVPTSEVTARSLDVPNTRCGGCGAGVPPDAGACTYCGSEIVREHARLRLICPECFARNADHHRFCTACGVAFRPERPLECGSRFDCPVCEEALEIVPAGDSYVHRCPRCEGLWIARETFSRLVARAGELVDDTPSRAGEDGPFRDAARRAAFDRHVAYRRCPVCRSMMQRRNFGVRSGIIIDRCRAHGTWCDADELADIAAFVMAAGVPGSERPRPAYVRDDDVSTAADPTVPTGSEIRESVVELVKAMFGRGSR